jgi:hypothetical protein
VQKEEGVTEENIYNDPGVSEEDIGTEGIVEGKLAILSSKEQENLM